MVSNYFKSITKSTFAKNFLILVSGGAIAQIVGIIVSPIISRLYTPEDFGIFGSVVALSSIFSVIGSLKYETALVLERDQTYLDRIFKLCLYVLVIFSLLSTILTIIYYYFINKNTQDSLIIAYLPWLFPLTLFAGLYTVLKYYINNRMDYRTISSSQVYQRFGNVSTQVVFGLLNLKSNGLLLGTVLGFMAGCIGMAIKLKNEIIKLKFKIAYADLKQVALKYVDLPKYSSPQALVSIVSIQLPVFTFGFYYGIKIVGAYYFAMKIIQIPGVLFKQTIQQIFLKEASDLKDDIKKLNRLYTKTTVSLFFIALVPVAIVFFYGPYLFTLVFGKEWTQAGEFASWMTIWISAAIINPPAMNLFPIFNKQNLALYYEISMAIFRLIVLLVIPVYYNITVTIAVFSIMSMLFYFVPIVYWKNYLNKREHATN